MRTVVDSSLPLPILNRGKVRDVYAVDSERILLLATDRVSAFDVVCTEPVPYKGAVLTQLTAWWLRQLEGEIPHHMITADARKIIAAVPVLSGHQEALEGRAMLCRRAAVVPIECVVRGYIAGSAWKEYRAHGTLAGEPLPPGLRESDRLDPPIFSPATKAVTGHDENIPVSRMIEILGAEETARLERFARLVYERGHEIARRRGIIIADTKFEFGRSGGELLLVDEVLTPDSSRFWPVEGYAPGAPQPSFDKQPLRDWLDVQRAAGRWDGNAPAPALPDDVVASTSARYLDVFRRLTGSDLLKPHPT